MKDERVPNKVLRGHTEGEEHLGDPEEDGNMQRTGMIREY
jgi:hypothetical protein